MQPLSLLFALSVGASNTVLQGNVSCAAKKWGLADCEVILRSKEGTSETMTVTDGKGEFRIAGFDPGNCVVTFRKEGYKPHQRELILRLGTLRINAELLPDQ